MRGDLQLLQLLANIFDGILADYSGKVNIHLPSQHNTSHDNSEQDQHPCTKVVPSPTSTPTVHLHTRAGTVYTRIIVHVWRG